ncbi:malto-oligosyltrehalose synthase [Allocoleopsis franciscana]|uniref:Maltooligosyl trehalose synthase n=1 Tax=Allocoleopsis franciscana PCC 7113 TaxID=1173027 RepID=K9WI47_9CYAN|nr:malto-oligosyltrehalose synthase [Allocoleopsis franciscana]AFZ19459.1 maltooligosyl trehalose synthase [Allocoleopsis franciscana PCC 7113]
MRIPTATYRIQFQSVFKFEAAKNILDYLADLGISDLYASPIFKATPGSTHGYDVVDPTQLNPELGTAEDFEALVSEIKNHDMGWVQDIVPNHMAYHSQNAWLMDVLENGIDSDFSGYFDIEWEHTYEDIKGRILAPMMGNFYGEALHNGEIQLNYEESELSVNYYALKLPVRIESYGRFISQNLGQVAREIGKRHPDFLKLLGILHLIKSVPYETKGKERYGQIAFVKVLLWELYNQNPEIKDFVDSNIKLFNGEKGNPESFNLLDSLLQEQFYRLSFWKVGAEEINYRRFFTVNELISMRVQELKVFHKTHDLVGQLVEQGKVTGLRIDHIDGLYDPTEYLKRLREKTGDVYITVEKILELKEELPKVWPIQGTSGYDFLNYVNGLFCKTESEKHFTDIYSQLNSAQTNYEQLFFDKKNLIVEKNLAGDVDNLAQILKRIAGQSRLGIDFTMNGLKRTLSEVLCLFPVYRTYVNGDGLSEDDRIYIEEAIEEARGRIPLLLNELNFIERLLLLDWQQGLTEEQKGLRLHFIMRFQQLTGPLMAKGIEDTLFYVYNRHLALNEVGGNPGKFGVTIDEFHQANQKESAAWPHKMNATATHDTKRGEDVRARLNVLSEIPDEWEKQVITWIHLNRSKKNEVRGRAVPVPNDEYFFYQTLVGSYPFDESENASFIGRIKDYMLKSVREAKLHTAWLRPDSAYEEEFLAFVERVLEPSDSNEFMKEFLPFQKWVAGYGIFNSLSQVLLKYTAPGVPDTYQGTEFWDLSMVDPDNRRPVDYQQRISCLQEIKQKLQTDSLKLIEELLSNQEDGRIKLFLTYRALQARKENLTVFQKGDYLPLNVTGTFKDHIVAFARRHGETTAIAIAPRFLTSLIEPGALPLGESVWQDTRIELPQGMPKSWTDTISLQAFSEDGIVSIGKALQHFPVALLKS